MGFHIIDFTFSIQVLDNNDSNWLWCSLAIKLLVHYAHLF